ncbi:MAG TPA: hypothetical protein VHX61_06265 [Rhizomicrobium sp.]|jgi:hypothetical protein|nr:hypothetical protein [Rhizomicrobium sp.]
MSKHTSPTAANLLVRKRNSPPMHSGSLVGGSLALLLVSTLAGTLARGKKHAPVIRVAAEQESARDLRRGAAMIAASVLLDSAFEHFNGNYENRAMFAAPCTAALALAAALSGTRMRIARAAAFGVSALVGTIGMAFHLYNVSKRPGGFSWNNLFYAAPLGAPGGLAVAGALGLSAMALEGDGPPQLRAALKSGRVLSFATAGALMATTAEAWLMHFRGAFHDPAMYAPVTLPPVTAAAMVAAAAAPGAKRFSLAGKLVGLTTIMGFVGSGFHVFGVHRNMGGWRNWTQMLFQGPPIPAPPSFAAIALAGRAALRLLKAGHIGSTKHG